MPPRKDPNLSKSSATYISDLCPSGVTEAAAILAQYRDPQVTPTPAPGTLRTKRRVEYPVQSPAQYSLLLPAAPSLPASGRQSLDMADPPQLAGLPKMSPGKKKRDKLAESILGDDASASSISKSSNSSSSSEEEKKRKKKKSKKKKKKRSRKYSDSDSDQSAARMTKKAKLALQEGFESDSPEEDDILPSQRTRPVSSGLSQMGGVSPSQLAYFGSQAMETAPLSRRQALDRARERPQKALSMADLSKDEIGVIIQYRECIRRNQAEAASRGVAAPGDPPLYQDFERWRVARAQYDARIIPSSSPNVPALIQDRIVSRSPSPSVAAGLSPTLMPPPAYDAVDPVKTRVVKKDPKKLVPASPKLVVKEPKDTRGRSKSSKSSSSKKEGKDKVQIKVEPTSPEDGGREFTTTMKTDDLKEYLRTRGIAEHIAMAVPGSQVFPCLSSSCSPIFFLSITQPQQLTPLWRKLFLVRHHRMPERNLTRGAQRKTSWEMLPLLNARRRNLEKLNACLGNIKGPKL